MRHDGAGAGRWRVRRIGEPGDQARVGVLVYPAGTIQVIQQPPGIVPAEHFANHPGRPAVNCRHWTMTTRADPLQCAGPVGDHPAWIGQGGEQLADDPQARPAPAARNNQPPGHGLEPGQAQPASPRQVTAVAVHDDRHGRGPGR
jgi:hypothetical protein